jgi:hypothetical protein
MIPVETPDIRLTVHEVLGGCQCDQDDLLALHAALFPQYAYYQTYMRQRAQQPPNADPRFVEHWWLIRLNDQPAAIRFFKYVPERNCGLGLAVGIQPEYRQHTFGRYRRFSEAIVLASLEQLCTDAKALGKLTPVGMISEIEAYLLPRYYREYGFIRLPIDYTEPSLTAEAQKLVADTEDLVFRPMELGILPSDPARFDPQDSEMLRQIVLAFLVDHYGLSENHLIVRRALASIPTALTTEEN